MKCDSTKKISLSNIDNDYKVSIRDTIKRKWGLSEIVGRSVFEYLEREDILTVECMSLPVIRLKNAKITSVFIRNYRSRLEYYNITNTIKLSTIKRR